MSQIETAILLAAGEGSRLRVAEPLKPLCPVGGKALIDHALDALEEVGIKRAIVVTGFAAETVEAHLGRRRCGPVVRTVRTPDWRQPNGVSARAATSLLNGEPALLAMCDHLVEPALYRRMLLSGPGEGLRLAVDRRLGHPWVDPEDVTCVRTNGGRIVAIGKGLDPHDAYDAGIFAVSEPFFSALRRLKSPSITKAVRALAASGKADVEECSDLDWIDVDDAAALAKAETWFATRAASARRQAQSA